MDVDKPCLSLDYCPYGPLVEQSPFTEKDKRCDVFGHDCPVYANHEPFVHGPEEEGCCCVCGRPSVMAITEDGACFDYCQKHGDMGDKRYKRG